MQPAFTNCLILTGPTASGKSAIALEFAEKANAEIIAMDSMTLYRGMDIGTAKPTLADRQRVPHHLIDVLDPTESSSVAWWLQKASQLVAEIQSRGKLPLFVGGTPFYLKAMVHGIFESPAVDPAIRRELEEKAAQGGLPEIHAELLRVDPISGTRIHPNDELRTIRALEVFRQTGRPLSELQQQNWFSKQEREPMRVRGMPQVLTLDLPREELYNRINQRVEAMVREGWLDEVQSLFERYPTISREASQAVGYRILKDHRDGKISLQSAIEMIQIRTRQFAKHQLTWFRNSPYGVRCEIREVLLNWSRFL